MNQILVEWFLYGPLAKFYLGSLSAKNTKNWKNGGGFKKNLLLKINSCETKWKGPLVIFFVSDDPDRFHIRAYFNK